MNKSYYISFGQAHVHSHNGKTLDKDCIGVIHANDYEQARKLAFEWFKGVFCMLEPTEPDMSFYPRGLIDLN